MILYHTQTIAETVDNIALQIKEDCTNQNCNDVMLICVLKGAAMFSSDLGRLLTKHGVDVTFDYIQIRSYEADSSSRDVKLISDTSSDISGKHVIIVEDIVDTGHSLQWLINHFQSRGAASVKVACLIDKTSRREVRGLTVDYVGFTLEDDKFVVGYGMDYDEKFRGFSCIFDGEELI